MRALSGYLVDGFLRTELAFPFGADSISRSVHCAPDENDRPIGIKMKINFSYVNLSFCCFFCVTCAQFM